VTAVPAPLASMGADGPVPAPITCAGIAAHASGTRYIRLSADSLRPYIGILGVLIGAILSFTGSRITTFGLADLRGGLHFGFDEGAWMTTSFGVGQMLIGVACPYLGAIFSVRRVLLHGMALLFIASLLGPLSPNLNAFLTAQFLAGVGTGTFIPLTIGFIVRNLPQRLVVYGLAVYAMNSELSQNVSASLEGWFTDNLSWRWIQWQFCIAVPLMFVCIWYGTPREKINLALLRDLDWPGLVYSGLGFSLLYAGLDQGNRLDWVNNGLVNGLLMSGALLTITFVVRELVVERPFLNLRLLTREGIVPILLVLAGFRFIILSTAYIIPTYLQVVQDYRELQVGAVLLWIALPQFLIVLPLGWLLSRVEARWVLALGAVLIGVACLMGTGLTHDWATDDFLPSQILQAIGQSFALTGGEIGTAFMQTFVRVREQVHSNLIGLHVDSLGGMTADRLAAYRNVVGAHTSDAAAAAARATSLLGAAVAKQAAVLSYIDGFLAAAVGAFVCLLFAALLRRH
jgi:MFS transporter, DHA2 family, multidrug resistance protein